MLSWFQLNRTKRSEEVEKETESKTRELEFDKILRDNWWLDCMHFTSTREKKKNYSIFCEYLSQISIKQQLLLLDGPGVSVLYSVIISQTIITSSQEWCIFSVKLIENYDLFPWNNNGKYINFETSHRCRCKRLKSVKL